MVILAMSYLLQVEEDPTRTNIGIFASMDRTTDAPSWNTSPLHVEVFAPTWT